MSTVRVNATTESPSRSETSSPVAELLKGVRRVPARVLLALLRTYQLVVSPWTAPSCRFYPSCSQYAVIAVQRHGALRGGWLAVRRLGRCHPWTAGGVDDVPPVRSKQTPAQRAGSDVARSSTR